MLARSQFSGDCRVLFHSDDAVTALSISPDNSGTFAYGTSRGLVAVWPPSSPLEYTLHGKRLRGEVRSMSWAAVCRTLGRTSCPITLVAGDSLGWVSLHGMTTWRSFRAFETGIEALSASSETLLAASDTSLKVWRIGTSEGGSANLTFLYQLSQIGQHELGFVRLVALHRPGDDGYETFTVVDATSQIFHVEATSGVLIACRDLSLNSKGVGVAKFYHDSKDWGHSQCVFSNPGVGFCLQNPIQVLEALQTIPVPQQEPSPSPVVVLHPGGSVIGSTSDQGIQVWDLRGIGSPVLSQTLRVPKSMSNHHVKVLEYGCIENKYSLVTAAQMEHRGWAVVAWDDSLPPPSLHFRVSFWTVCQHFDWLMYFLLGILVFSVTLRYDLVTAAKTHQVG